MRPDPCAVHRYRLLAASFLSMIAEACGWVRDPSLRVCAEPFSNERSNE
jgi:hypothetical protein